MILLDTVVLSETRKRKPTPSVLAWLKSLKDDEIFISVVSISEIERGIAKARLTDAAFANELSVWLEGLLQLYGDRILPVDAQIARRWGQLAHALGHDGADLIIAASALCHGLTVATRNVRHFEPTGVKVINPFGA